jgi:hypothetical protein
VTLPQMVDTPVPVLTRTDSVGGSTPNYNDEPEWGASPTGPPAAGGASRRAVRQYGRRRDGDGDSDVANSDRGGTPVAGSDGDVNRGDGDGDGDGGVGDGGRRHYFTCEGLAGVQVQVLFDPTPTTTNLGRQILGQYNINTTHERPCSFFRYFPKPHTLDPGP